MDRCGRRYFGDYWLLRYSHFYKRCRRLFLDGCLCAFNLGFGRRHRGFGVRDLLLFICGLCLCLCQTHCRFDLYLVGWSSGLCFARNFGLECSFHRLLHSTITNIIIAYYRHCFTSISLFTPTLSLNNCFRLRFWSRVRLIHRSGVKLFHMLNLRGSLLLIFWFQGRFGWFDLVLFLRNRGIGLGLWLRKTRHLTAFNLPFSLLHANKVNTCQMTTTILLLTLFRRLPLSLVRDCLPLKCVLVHRVHWLAR